MTCLSFDDEAAKKFHASCILHVDAMRSWRIFRTEERLPQTQCNGGSHDSIHGVSLQLPSVLQPIRHPDNNLGSPAKIALGKELFFDVRLSRNDRQRDHDRQDAEDGLFSVES